MPHDCSIRFRGAHLLASVSLVLGTVALPAQSGDASLGGRIHLDYAIHSEDVAALPDGHRMRRARLGGAGSVDDNWAVKLEFDFAEDTVTTKDAYLQYRGLSAGSLRIGNIKIPLGMDELTSSNHIPLMERALPSALAPSYSLGIAYDRHETGWGMSTMLFGEEVGSHNARLADERDERLGLGTRLYLNPLAGGEGSGLLHLGLAASIEDRDEGSGVRFSNRPESRATGHRFVDTGVLEGTETLVRFGLEAGFQSGPLTLQGEYLGVDLSRESGREDLGFHGYYAQGTYTFNGNRSYRNGGFRSPGKGAWELSLRLSHLDLDDGAVQGGEESNTTLGVNWYPANNVRFMLNYISVDSERAGVSDDPSIISFRTQVTF